MFKTARRKRERTKKGKKKMLKFRREETERNTQLELQLPKMYMQILGTPQISFAQQLP